LERRLVAILAADVVGYTRLMGADEAGTLARLKRFRAEVFDPAIAAEGGRVVKLMGDGALVEFPSVVRAVAAAAALQEAAAAHQAAEPEDRRITLRIGVNLGDVIVEGGDLYGDGVNIAARLEAQAEPGGICVTAKVRDEVGEKLGLAFEDMGEVAVKNVAGTVRIYRIAPARTAPSPKPLALPDKPSVAVLPFANMSGDPEQAYFSDGITEDIITELSRFRSLFVIARNSSFVYRGQAVDLRRVGRELGVRYVVEGSVRRAGGRVRITAQLIEAETGSHLWADRYDRELADIFEVQDEIARVIVSTLANRLAAAEWENRKRRPPANPTAYDLLLRGIDVYQRFTRYGNAEARRLYLRAIEADPDLVAAYHRLAWTHLIAFELGWEEPPERLVAEARAAAQRAVDLDPAEALAEMTRASACMAGRDYEAADIHARRAIRLNPNDAEIVVLRGNIEILLGDPASGLPLVEQAMRQNPFAPGYYLWIYGMGLYSTGRYAEALAAFREMKDPPTVIHAKVAATLARLGRMDEAAREMAAFLRLAESEHASYPGEDAAAWRNYFSQSLQFRNPADLDRWMEGFRLAGLPG
jgi:TolB-like protein